MMLARNHNFSLYDSGCPILCEKTSKYILQLYAIYLMEQVYGYTGDKRVDDFIVLLSIHLSSKHNYRDFNRYCDQNHIELAHIDSTYSHNDDEEWISDLMKRYSDLGTLNTLIFLKFLHETTLYPNDAKMLSDLLQFTLSIEDRIETMIKANPAHTEYVNTYIIEKGFMMTLCVDDVDAETKRNFHNTVHLLNESVCRNIPINLL